jgi:hypothetical protein
VQAVDVVGRHEQLDLGAAHVHILGSVGQEPSMISR